MADRAGAVRPGSRPLRHPATAGITATLFGRLIPGGLGLLLMPIVAILLWMVTCMELRAERGTGGRTIGELLLTAILFGGTAGLLALFGAQVWPTPLILVAVLCLPLALRAAEARGTMGVEGVGQATLHVLGWARSARLSSCSACPCPHGRAHGVRVLCLGRSCRALRGPASDAVWRWSSGRCCSWAWSRHCSCTAPDRPAVMPALTPP